MRKRLISTQAVANILGLSVRTVDRLREENRDGFPAPVQCDKHARYYCPEAIEKYKERCRVKPRRGALMEIFIEVAE